MFDQHFVFSFYENKECVMQIDYGFNEISLKWKFKECVFND
jgi:hypothetical protein